MKRLLRSFLLVVMLVLSMPTESFGIVIPGPAVGSFGPGFGGFAPVGGQFSSVRSTTVTNVTNVRVVNVVGTHGFSQGFYMPRRHYHNGRCCRHRRRFSLSIGGFFRLSF